MNIYNRVPIHLKVGFLAWRVYTLDRRNFMT